MSKATQAPRQAIVVLGMHRSGTSALTGTLKLLGCTAPVSSMKKDRYNSKGFFESARIKLLNDIILNSLDANWQSIQRFSPVCPTEEVAERFLTAAQNALRNQFCDAPLFAFKDPRLCRLAPFWIKALEGASIQPLFVHIHRNPLEVAESLLTRNSFPHPKSLLLWMRYILDAEIATRNQPRVFTNFGQLLENWTAVADKVQDEFGIIFPNNPNDAADEIAEFLAPDLRHHHFTTERLGQDNNLPKQMNTLLEIMDRWATKGETPRDHKILDHLREELDLVSEVINPDDGDESQTEECALEALIQIDGRVSDTFRKKVQNSTATKAELLTMRDDLLKLNTALRSRVAMVCTTPGNNQTATVEHLQQELETRHQELAEFTQLLIDSETDLLEAQSGAIKAAERHNIEMEDQSRKLNGTNASLQKNLQSKEQDIQNKEREIQNLHSAVLQAIEDLKATRESTSWRITGPMRALSRLLRQRK